MIYLQAMKTLLIDDEKILSVNIWKKIEQSGGSVDIIHSLKDYQKVKTKTYWLFIIDLSLGDGSGFEIIKDIREKKKLDTPIIIISWHSWTYSKIKWLDIWADDYITKPFAPDELMARIRSLLRRKNSTWCSWYLKYKDICFHLGTREITKCDESIVFSKKEKQIIEFFLLHKNKLVSKRNLVESLWKSKDYQCVTDNTINVTIYKIRKKLWKSFELKTKVWEGYILQE